MNDETIVAVFDSSAAADAAVRDLEAAQVPSSAISRHSGQGISGKTGAVVDETGVEPGGPSGKTGTVVAETGAVPVDTAEAPRERGFWSRIFGAEPDYDPAVYDRSVQSGGVVLTVKTTADRAERIMNILERHNPVDLNERAASYGLAATRPAVGMAAGGVTGAVTPGTRSPTVSGSGRVPTDRTAGTDGGTLELSEEQLSVGKRAVNRGTTRIHRFVVETPVEQQVTLHDEKVTIERRPVTDGRTAKAADFSDKVVEMTETTEEPVVSKTARVREEVVIGKTATEHTETVRDTVRREDVEIEGGTERMPGKPPVSGAAGSSGAPRPPGR